MRNAESISGNSEGSLSVQRQFQAQLTGLLDGTLILRRSAGKARLLEFTFFQEIFQVAADEGKQPAANCRSARTEGFSRQIGVTDGDLVMAHTAVTNLQLRDDSKNNAEGGFLETADRLVNDLLEMVGPAGTLVMPTHAIYQNEEAFSRASQGNTAIYYDPRQTPCRLGWRTSFFGGRKAY